MRYGHMILSVVGATLLWSLAARPAAGQETGKVLIPHNSWTCGMAEGIPSPETGRLIFELKMTLGTVADVGRTPYGMRRIAVGQEAAVSGPKFSGSVLSG